MPDPRDGLVGGADLGEDHGHVGQGGVVGLVVPGGVAVLHEQHLVAHLHRVPDGGFAAGVGEGPGHDQGVDAARGQDLVQPAGARDEGAEPALVEDGVLGPHVQGRPQLIGLGAGLEGFGHGCLHLVRQPIIPGGPLQRLVRIHHEADEDVQAAGIPDRRRDAVDVVDDVAGERHFRNGARRHEPDLQVDDHMGGPGGVDDNGLHGAPPGDPLERGGGNLRLVHDVSSS